MSGDITQVVNVLADLAATGQRRKIRSVDADLMEWLPMSYTAMLKGYKGFRPDKNDEGTRTFFNTETTRRIFKTGKLRSDDDEDGVLRLGWLWVAGRHPEHGQLLTPLVSFPVRRTIGDAIASVVTGVLARGRDDHADLQDQGDPELTDLIEDQHVRRTLATLPDLSPEWGDSPDLVASRTSLAQSSDLREWAISAAAAAGIEVDQLVGAKHTPARFARRRPVVVAGMALYVAPPQHQRSATSADTLRAWADQRLDDTALAVVYDDTVPRERDDVGSPAPSPFELNAAQRRAVDAVSRERLTVLSGPPGTGKSQTVAAVAFDQVRRGRSVLVVAPTSASVTALTALMEDAPGPDPMVFGATTHRLDVAGRLTEHASLSHERDVVDRRRQTNQQVHDEVQRLRAAIVTLLVAEQAASVDPTELMLARAEAPGVFEYGADLDQAQELVESLMADELRRSWWWRRRSASRDLDRLRTLCRAGTDEAPNVLARHVALAVAQRRNADLAVSGGLDLAQLWDSLIDASERLRDTSGALLDAATHQRDHTDRKSQRAIATVAAALRAGRTRRREMLAEVDATELLEPLPLWVATLRDVDDLLPMRPAMFDLVIIDEASHIDQVSAAPVLLRGKSALVVGDPRQLRHVSFVSAERIDNALADNQLTGRPVAAQLDVQRTSLFDAAVSVQPPLLLDEHYRSVPHLIDFSAQRFYDGKVGVATRHPATEHEDSIEVVEVDGFRNAAGVNVAEVSAIVQLVRSRELMVDRGTVGVITPFRAQAEALEAALRESFELSEIDRLDLRVGTVHGFQGCQRDITYLSMGVDDGSPAGSRSFIDDAALFNVMVTRARRSVVVVTSAKQRLPKLLADYIRHGEHPEVSSPEGHRSGNGHWPPRVVNELRDAGLAVRTHYPVGRHRIDAVVGTRDAAIGIICGVHPDGPDAHVDRHLELQRLGWTIREVFESQWGEQLPALAVELRSSTLG